MGTGGRRHRCCRGIDLRAVVGHMRPNEMPSGKGTHERELSSHDSRRDDAGKGLRVLAGLTRVSSSYSEQVENALLRCKDCASTDGPDFYTGHVDTDEKIFSSIGSITQTGQSCWSRTQEYMRRLTAPSTSCTLSSPHSGRDLVRWQGKSPSKYSRRGH